MSLTGLAGGAAGGSDSIIRGFQIRDPKARPARQTSGLPRLKADRFKLDFLHALTY
jgi:hypothetical protein